LDLSYELLVIVVLTLINGFFSAAEIGVISIRRTRLQELASEGRRGARAALTLRKNPEQFLATVQIGITVVGATAGAFGGAVLEAPLAEWLTQLGVGTAADELALALVVAFVSVLSIVLGELVPKSLALRASEPVSLAVARPLLWLSRFTKPLVWLLTSMSNLILRPFRDETTFSEARLSPEELQHLVEEASETGSLSPTAGDIASRAIELSELAVGSLLIPRPLVTYVRRDASKDEVWDLLKNRPHARYPVVEQDLDSVEGYVLYRDLVRQLVDDGEVRIDDVLREVPIVMERTPAVEVLRTLQAKHAQLAVVVDAQGMITGIVTIGDVAEELLGDILGESERSVEAFRVESEGVVLVRSTTPVQELNRGLGIDLPISANYSTLSGLLMTESGRIMKVGEELWIDRSKFVVVDASPRQVKLVRMHLPARKTDDADDADEESAS
jgi:putative hemolysin